jgi:DNA replication protein DnaC
MTTEQLETPSVCQLTNEWQATFDRMLSHSRKVREDLEAWALDKPQSRICETHKHVGKIDWEKSARETHQRGEKVLFYERCPMCERYEGIIRRSEWLVARGVPKNLSHAAFENFEPQTPGDAKVLEQARRFARVKRGFFVMLGSPGSGKSHLAVSIMREMVAGRLITHVDMMAQVRAHYDDKTVRDIIPVLQRQPMLVMDEIGFSDGGSDNLPKLHQVLVERYNNYLPTVITGNLSRVGLEECLGPRLVDRFAEACFGIACLTGPSKRRSRRDEYFKGAE